MAERVLIAGSRSFHDYNFLAEKCNFYLQKVEIECFICGMAPGADMLGYFYAKNNGYEVWEYPAMWKELGRKAGYIRNKTMGEKCTIAIIFWDGQSPGTKSMIEILDEMKKPYRRAFF